MPPKGFKRPSKGLQRFKRPSKHQQAFKNNFKKPKPQVKLKKPNFQAETNVFKNGNNREQQVHSFVKEKFTNQKTN